MVFKKDLLSDGIVVGVVLGVVNAYELVKTAFQ